MYTFTMRPTTPSPALRAELREAARAMLAPVMPVDAPVQPHETLDADEGAGDTAIEAGDEVSYFPPGAWSARPATVECVRADGQLLLRFAYSGMRWAWGSDVKLILKKVARELEAMG